MHLPVCRLVSVMKVLTCVLLTDAKEEVSGSSNTCQHYRCVLTCCEWQHHHTRDDSICVIYVKGLTAAWPSALSGVQLAHAVAARCQSVIDRCDSKVTFRGVLSDLRG